MKNKKLLWKLCVAAVACIIVITYTPLVIPSGRSIPFFLYMPYTLWITILLTIALVVLTYLGGMVIPHDEEDEQ